MNGFLFIDSSCLNAITPPESLKASQSENCASHYSLNSTTEPLETRPWVHSQMSSQYTNWAVSSEHVRKRTRTMSSNFDNETNNQISFKTVSSPQMENDELLGTYNDCSSKCGGNAFPGSQSLPLNKSFCRQRDLSLNTQLGSMGIRSDAPHSSVSFASHRDMNDCQHLLLNNCVDFKPSVQLGDFGQQPVDFIGCQPLTPSSLTPVSGYMNAAETGIAYNTAFTRKRYHTDIPRSTNMCRPYAASSLLSHRLNRAESLDVGLADMKHFLPPMPNSRPIFVHQSVSKNRLHSSQETPMPIFYPHKAYSPQVTVPDNSQSTQLTSPCNSMADSLFPSIPESSIHPYCLKKQLSVDAVQSADVNLATNGLYLEQNDDEHPENYSLFLDASLGNSACELTQRSASPFVDVIQKELNHVEPPEAAIQAVKYETVVFQHPDNIVKQDSIPKPSKTSQKRSQVESRTNRTNKSSRQNTFSDDSSNDGVKAMNQRKKQERLDGDIYTPEQVRYGGIKKEGLCTVCPENERLWYKMRESAYRYHMQNKHGISAASLTYFRQAEAQIVAWVLKETTGATKTPQTNVRLCVESFCGECRKWIDVWWKKKKINVTIDCSVEMTAKMLLDPTDGVTGGDVELVATRPGRLENREDGSVDTVYISLGKLANDEYFIPSFIAEKTRPQNIEDFKSLMYELQSLNGNLYWFRHASKCHDASLRK